MNDERRICLNKQTLDFMENVLTPESLVLEFGSGWSSSWFAKRCDHLVTVETDRKWAQRVGTDLMDSRFLNWQMIVAKPAPVVFGSTVDRLMCQYGFSDESMDLILVDCREDLRNAAVRLAWRFLKPGGWILFDDAQREQHFGAVSWLSEKAGPYECLEWQPGDIESATERLTLAWQKEQ